MSSPKDEHDHDQPLLDEDRLSLESDIELATLEGERTPDIHYKERNDPPKKRVSFILIAIVFTITVLSFAVNTESTAYFEDELGWKKPFATLYVTHSTLVLPWICHISYLRWKDRHVPFKDWFEDYLNMLRGSIATVDAYTTSGRFFIFTRKGQTPGPLAFLASTMAVVTAVLTVSGVSWFVSLSLTTPADLSAIYNCATFFAAAFSVPILKEKLGWISIGAVALSIIGTFIIAYGDTTGDHVESPIGTSRLLGNIVACIGAVAFGLYEVLLKKWACPSRPESSASSLPLTLAASAFTGFYTLTTLWMGLIALHFLGVERFVWPDAYDSLWIIIAVLAGACKSSWVTLARYHD